MCFDVRLRNNTVTKTCVVKFLEKIPLFIKMKTSEIILKFHNNTNDNFYHKILHNTRFRYPCINLFSFLEMRIITMIKFVLTHLVTALKLL